MADSLNEWEMQMEMDRLAGKVVAIFGYREDGVWRAKQLREHGVTVIFGIRSDRDECLIAQQNGEKVLSPEEAARLADVIQVW